MTIRKIKLELRIESNKKTCGNCKHRTWGYCLLFDMPIHLQVHLQDRKDYKRLDKCIDAEAKYKNGDKNA